MHHSDSTHVERISLYNQREREREGQNLPQSKEEEEEEEGHGTATNDGIASKKAMEL
jgi:hypothetical protein